MKWAIYLFSIYILFLSAIPCGGKESCCAGETEITSPINKDQEAGHKPVSPCSPFFACGTCHLGTLPTMVINLATVPLPISNQVYFHPIRVTKEFQPSIWQPPQLA